MSRTSVIAHLVGFVLFISFSAAQSPHLTADTVIGLGTLDAVAPSPDGTKLLTAGSLGITFWDLETWKDTTLIPERARQLSWDTQGKRFASQYNRHVQIWDASKNELIKSLGPHSFQQTFVLSPNGNLIASVEGWQEQWVNVYDWNSETIPNTSEPKGLFSFLERRPASLPRGAVHSYVLAGTGIHYIAFTSESTILSVSDTGTIQEAKFTLGSSEVSLGTTSQKHLPNVNRLKDVTFNASYTKVAAVTGSRLTVWSYPQMREVASLLHDSLSSAVFTRDGTAIIAVDSNGNGLRWNYTTDQITSFGTQDTNRHGQHNVILVGIEEDILVYDGFGDGTLNLYDADTLSEAPLPIIGYNGSINNFRVATDESSLLVGSSFDTYKNYSLPDGRLLNKVKQAPRQACGSSSGMYYYSPGIRYYGFTPLESKDQLILSETDTCLRLATLEGFTAPVSYFTISSNGSYALISTGNVVEIWNLKNKKRLFSPDLYMNVPHRQEGVKLSPSNGIFSTDETLAVVNFGNALGIFDMNTQEEVTTITTLVKGSFSATALSSDNKYLVGGDSFGNLFIWSYPDRTLQYQL